MDADDAAAVTASVEENPATWPGVHLLRGKKVLELTVVTTNKGRALKALMKANHCTATVFIGDDITDENAFGVLEDDDVGIKVGSAGRSPTPGSPTRAGSPTCSTCWPTTADGRRNGDPNTPPAPPDR